jgi:transposase
VPVADEPLKVHLFVATLGYSRRTFVAEFLHERQSAWLQGLEGAFRHFDGTTQEVLVATSPRQRRNTCKPPPGALDAGGR